MAPSGQRSITLVGASTSQLAALGPKPTKEDIEKHWASKVTGPSGESVTRRTASLSIAMSGQSLEDARMGDWCAWFTKFVKDLFGREHVLHIRDANFSSNRLTAKGVQQLLSTLQQLRARVGVLKLFQNELTKADDVLDFIISCEGCLRELHLSHNKLDTVGVRDVIVTVAAATCASGGYAYPRAGTVPLWLRLEGNKFDPAELVRLLKAALQQIGRPYEKSICEVDGKSKCCPGFCDQCRTPPPVHITYMKLADHARNRNTIPVNISKAPSLPKAALKAAAAVAAGAKASASGAGPKASAPAASASSAYPAAAKAPALARTTSAPEPAREPALDAPLEAAALPAAALQRAVSGPPPGLEKPPGLSPKGWGNDTPKQDNKSFSLQEDFPALPATPSSGPRSGAAKSKAKAGNWGAKSPSAKAGAKPPNAKAAAPPSEAPAVTRAPKQKSSMGDQDFPALPSLGNKGRSGKTSPKHFPGPEKAQKHSIPEPQETPSTSASTGDDEQDDGQPEDVAGESKIQGASSYEFFPVATVDAEACQTKSEVCHSGVEASHEVEDDMTTLETLADSSSHVSGRSHHEPEPEASVKEEENSGWTRWIAYQDYEAEAPGYLSVYKNEALDAYQVDSPTSGDAHCGWSAYVFGNVPSQKGLQGWVPVDILASRYLTETGRKWLYVPSTEQCRWEEEEEVEEGMVLQEE